MKSSGNDNDASGSQDKPPLASPENESEKAILIEAMAFVYEVKDAFHDQEHKYKLFLAVMNAYGDKRIDDSTLIERIKVLFKGRNNLIIGFNKFRSPASQIPLDDEEDHTVR